MVLSSIPCSTLETRSCFDPISVSDYSTWPMVITLSCKVIVKRHWTLSRLHINARDLCTIHDFYDYLSFEGIPNLDHLYIVCIAQFINELNINIE